MQLASSMLRLGIAIVALPVAAAPTHVRVVAREYALEAPDSVRAGSITLEFENRGMKDHELIVGLMRRGTGATEIVAAHQKGTSFRVLQTVYLEGAASGMLYAAPNSVSPAALVVPLMAGRTYVLLCQLRDSVGASQHAALGMFHLLHAR